MARARRILALLLCTQQSQNDINGPKMRAATFTNRALVALLAALVIGSTLGNSTEPARVRVTTWNLEWFPNGSAHDATPEVQAQRIAAHDATPEVQAQRIAAAADVLRSLKP